MISHASQRRVRAVVSGVVALASTVAWAGVVAPTARAATTLMPGTYAAVTPARILDTRFGIGVPGAAAVAPHGTVSLKVFGVGGVPASNVAAVVMNVTEVGPTAAGNITVYPSGVAMPTVSNLNFGPGDVRPNLVTVKVGADGYVKLTNSSAGSTHLIADVAGYFVGGTPTLPGTFSSLTPSRLLDTRLGTAGALPPNGTRVLQVTGQGGVPTSNVKAVVLNVTEVGPTAPGFITVFPAGTAVPTASNLNFLGGDVRANLVTVMVSANGQVAFKNSSVGPTHLVVDIAGYYRDGIPTAAGAFRAQAPVRVYDSREAGWSKVAPQGIANLQAVTPYPLARVAAAFMNVTETQPTAAGFITAYQPGQPMPIASNLNFVAGDTYPNAVVAPTTPEAQITLANGSTGSTHLIVDVAGIYLRSTLNSLSGGEMLWLGEAIVSPNWQYTLVQQADGNLVLYNANYVPLWSTGITGFAYVSAVMQTDGNFVVYNAADQPLWQSGTSGHPGATLQVRDDGHLAVTLNGQALWVS